MAAVTWHPDIPLDFRNQVVTGDARVLAERLPSESVDLIFTDPVYDRIEDYEWLGREAARVLKPDSACLVWCANSRILNCAAAMQPALSYVKTISFHLARIIAGRPAYRRDNRSLVLWTPLLWMEKGTSKATGRMTDFGWTNWGNGEQGHAWHKAIGPISRWLECLCPQNGVVADPFTGGGTVPAVCKQLGRNWVAFEVDPETAALARERVRLTPEPLFVLDAPDPQTTFAEALG